MKILLLKPHKNEINSLESDLPEELVDIYFHYLDFNLKRFPNMDRARLTKIYNEEFEEAFLSQPKNNVSAWKFPK